MSSKPFRRRRFIALAALTIAAGSVSACGFKPLYGQDGSATAPSQQVQSQLASIVVDKIPDRVGQLMRTALKRRLTPRGQVAQNYRLSVNLTESLTSLAVEQNAFATRANLTLTATYSLIRMDDSIELVNATVKQVASYNILTSDFATLAAQDDARSRAVQNLADSMRTRLAIYFNGPAKSASQPQPTTNPYAVR